MRELTFEEFTTLIKKCNDFEDNGSSRAVFNLYWEGIGYVIKLAGDRQGRLQNTIEKNFYEQSGEASYLNPIVAYFQDIMIVSEWVNVLSYDIAKAADEKTEEDFIEWCEEYLEDYRLDCIGVETKDDMSQLYWDLRDVVMALSKKLDCTSDNYQLGINPNGNGYGAFGLVSYDYGYDSSDHYKREEIVGNVENYICYNDIENSPLFDRIWYYINNGEDDSYEDYDEEDDYYYDEDEEEEDGICGSGYCN